MKGVAIAISGMIVLMSGLVYGQSDTQAGDPRQINQEDWIERSFDRGPLTRGEADRLDRKQERVDRGESRVKVDGVLKRKEAARTGAAKKRPSRHILGERPDRQGAPQR